MSAQLSTMFDSSSFMPHGHCYLWTPPLVWLQVLSNAAIALAYVFIFGTLVYLVRRVRDIPFQWMYVAFAVFIVACGITHAMDVYVIWQPAYWLDGSIRAVTALASVGTAMMLPPLVPKAIALADAASVSHERGMKLETANRELATLLDRSKELEQLKTQFFANVSHELRTPLALVLGPVEELLRADNLRDAQRKSLETIQRNATSLLRQVNDLLEIAKLEAGKVEPDYVAADLAGLVRLTASQFESLASDRRIHFDISAPPAAPAEFDVDKLQRVLLNLLSNAFKFTPEGGSIACALHVDPRAEPEGMLATIEVEDSGPGIPEAQRGVVFERFRQLEGGSTRRFGGTGLGLAIVKELIELHGGSVELGQGSLGGARFRLRVPLRAAIATELRDLEQYHPREAAAQLAAALRSVATSDPTPSGRGEGLVLVVEDNPEMNSFLCTTLQEESRVASAVNGREGLALARELQPDLVLTDVMMPGMSGDELVRELRADPSTRAIPAIVLTAKADDALRIALLRSGAQDYVLKPFSAEEVRARVRNLVSVKRAGDLLRAELDSKSQDLTELADQLSRRKRELTAASETLKLALEHALQANRAKTGFLSMVSHELRTPLTSVRLQTDKLLRLHRSAPNDAQAATMHKLDQACMRLEQMLESLLEYSAIQAGRLDLRLSAVRLADVVADAVEPLRAHAEQKKLVLELDLDASLPTLQTDTRLVHLMVSNLLANAIKFTDQGSVRVALSGDETQQRIAVIDTGPGIPEEERARIFEPFEQIEPVRRKHIPGIGVGLSLVREMAHALGGDVEVVSELGQGSTFTITLPAASSQDVPRDFDARRTSGRG